jgi:hypothetical protein
VIAVGLPASPGAAVGQIVFTAQTVEVSEWWVNLCELWVNLCELWVNLCESTCGLSGRRRRANCVHRPDHRGE